MAGKIKGITIELNADTSKLDKSLRDVQKNTKAIDRELSQVNKSLKFNPRNVDLLRQKQQLLSEKVGETTKKLDLLKQKQKQMDASGVDKSSKEYRELQREILKAENQQKYLNAEIRKIKAATSPLGRASASMKEFANKASAAGQAMKPISAAAAAVDVALAGLAYKSGQAADDLNTLAKVTGIGTDELQKYKLASDLVDVSVETIAKSQTKLKKNMLSAVQGFDTLTVAADGTVSGGNAVAKAFETLGVKVTDSNGELRNQEDVFQETIEALGKMQNETERDALAMQIFGKSATELNPLIEDAGETYKQVADIFNKNGLKIADQETIDQANQFNDSLDTIKMTWSAALNQVGMQLAGYLAPAMEKVAEIAGKIAGWLSQLDPQVLAIIGIIAGVVAAIAPVLIIVGKVAAGISAIMSLMSTLGVSLTALAGPVGIVIAIIAALIAAGVAVYKNWDKIKEKAAEVKDWVVEKWTALKTSVSNLFESIKQKVISVWNSITAPIKNALNTILVLWKVFKIGLSAIIDGIKATVSAKFEAIKEKIITPIEKAKEIIKGIIEKIKGFFNFNVSLPHIKLPHFSVQPAGWKIGDLLKGSIPSLGIDWYKQGAIFTKPTIAGLGEAGPEGIIPLDTLWKKMDNIANASGGGGTTIVLNINNTNGLDERQLVSEVKRQLINEVKGKKLAWG